MSCTEDKNFAGASCSTEKEFSPVTPGSSGFVAPTPGAVDPAAAFPHPFGPYQLQPDQSMALGLEIDQFLNKQALGLKAVGEEVVVYRQKLFGEPCACVDPDTNQAQGGCRICFGTRFVGGYDLMGKTAAYIGANPLARKLTELGIEVSQKPSITILPDFPIKDRDFVVAKGQRPLTDLIRIQQEPVTRAAVDPNMDLLSKLNVRKVIKISNTKGGAEDYAENTDFILTGGELVVEDALTAPPNADSRVLRIRGKRAPLFPPDSESPTGETDEVPVLIEEAGFSAGLPVTVFNRAAKPQAFSTTMQAGTGADIGFFLITLTGEAASGISDQGVFPASEFLTVIVGDSILWLTGGGKPVDAATYYVTYEAALNVTRRYQLLNATSFPYQGVTLAQQADIALMDQTHMIYNVASIFDNGTPLDRQVGSLDTLRKTQAARAGLVTDAPNNADPRFVNPGNFF